MSGRSHRGVGDLTFLLNKMPFRLPEDSAMVTVPNDGHGAAVRADVYYAWMRPRRATDTVPRGARLLGLRVGSRVIGFGNVVGRPRFAGTSRRKKIDALVGRVEALPAPQFGRLECPPHPPAQRLTTLTLQYHRGGRPLARLTEPVPAAGPSGACQPLIVSRPGHPSCELEEGQSLIRGIRGLRDRARPQD